MGDEPMERLVRSLKDDLDTVEAERDRLRATTETLSKRVDGYRTKLGQIAAERDRLRAVLDAVWRAGLAVLDGIDWQRATGKTEPVPINRLADLQSALAALDGSAEATDG